MNNWLIADLRDYTHCFSAPLSRDHEKKEEDILMRNVLLRRATEEDTHKPDRRSPPSTPRWVKVSAIIFIILVLLFVLQHLAGGIFMGHMPGM